jgi:hypothetical protein
MAVAGLVVAGWVKAGARAVHRWAAVGLVVARAALG